jgi:hypothetical protein
MSFYACCSYVRAFILLVLWTKECNFLTLLAPLILFDALPENVVYYPLKALHHEPSEQQVLVGINIPTNNGTWRPQFNFPKIFQRVPTFASLISSILSLKNRFFSFWYTWKIPFIFTKNK